MSTTTRDTTAELPDGTSEATATLNRDSDGGPLGAMVYLTEEDLRALGVDVDTVDQVSYQVEGGRLDIE